MSILYTSHDGYVAVGKPQTLHHGLLYYPPNFYDSNTSKEEWAADYNRTLRIRVVGRSEDGTIEYIDVPVDFRNYALTADDINANNRPIGNQSRIRENKHRFLSKREIDHNNTFLQYSFDMHRVTWRKAMEAYGDRRSTLFRIINSNKNALKRALLTCHQNYFLGMTLPRLVEERRVAIAERNRLKAKGLSAYRAHHGNNLNNQILLSQDDFYRFRYLTSIVRTLNEKTEHDSRVAA